MRDALLQNYDLDESDAGIVARDQARKFEAAQEQARQLAEGHTKYVWWTQLDNRVRPTHQRNHGREFSWLDPPEPTGHPGHDSNCRCYPVPVLGS